MNEGTLYHGIAPVYNETSRVLILGTFPSVASRRQMFYYGHPQNRFWPMMAAIFGSPAPESIDEKKKLLLDNGIALWDVAASCEIAGSADSSIRHAAPNDIGRILAAAPIERLLANGTTAGRLYGALCRGDLGRDITVMPSTSPANASKSLAALTEAWRRAILG